MGTRCGGGKWVKKKTGNIFQAKFLKVRQGINIESQRIPERIGSFKHDFCNATAMDLSS